MLFWSPLLSVLTEKLPYGHLGVCHKGAVVLSAHQLHDVSWNSIYRIIFNLTMIECQNFYPWPRQFKLCIYFMRVVLFSTINCLLYADNYCVDICFEKLVLSMTDAVAFLYSEFSACLWDQ